VPTDRSLAYCAAIFAQSSSETPGKYFVEFLISGRICASHKTGNVDIFGSRELHNPPDKTVAARMDHLLQTPFISNEAYFAGALAKRPSSEVLGPFLRATFWNIERGLEFESIRTALVEPDKFDRVIQARDSNEE
jgi:hypothetical protein